jgi:hypothetical protein
MELVPFGWVNGLGAIPAAKGADQGDIEGEGAGLAGKKHAGHSFQNRTVRFK